MLNDVSEAFEGWLEPLTILRKDGSYVDGIWVDGVETPIIINAVIQNANPDDLIVLPEGERTTEAVKIHTTSAVRTVIETSESEADEFVYDGLRWRIYNLANRKIGNYYKAIAIRVKS